MIKKIISGGLPRVELAALDAAIELGIPHEGWTYKSRKTENGILPEQQTRAQRLDNCAKNGEAKVRGILFAICVSE
jgi:hypothetical protein